MCHTPGHSIKLTATIVHSWSHFINYGLSSQLLQLQMIKAIVNSHKFKGLSSDEPRRVQVLDLYCLTRFENKSSGGEDVY